MKKILQILLLVLVAALLVLVGCQPEGGDMPEPQEIEPVPGDEPMPEPPSDEPEEDPMPPGEEPEEIIIG